MLDILLKTINPDIGCLTETWLNPIIGNQQELISQSYSIQSRSDRKLGQHGGVLIAHRNTLCKMEVLRTNSDFICCCLYFFKEVIIVIINIFNPPADSKYRLSADLFCKTIQEIVRDVQEYQRSFESFIFSLNGDINFTHTDWLTLSSNCSYEEVVLSEFKKLNLSSIQSHASSLDIFLSNNINLCSGILEEKSFSDHKFLLAEISIEYAEQGSLPQMKSLNIGKANWDEFTINSKFPMYSFDSIDNIVDSFYHKLELASSIAIPLKTSIRTNAPFYMSSNSIHLENKLKTSLKNTQSAEKNSRLREELSFSLDNDKKHFVKKAKSGQRTMHIN